ncbi:MAG: hypothetical protein ACLT2T_15770 [Bilophila wadsworthia]
MATQSAMPHRMSSSTMGAEGRDESREHAALGVLFTVLHVRGTVEDLEPMMNCVLMARQSTRMSTRIAIRGQPMAATAMLRQTVSLWTCSRLFSMPGSCARAVL